MKPLSRNYPSPPYKSIEPLKELNPQRKTVVLVMIYGGSMNISFAKKPDLELHRHRVVTLVDLEYWWLIMNDFDKKKNFGG